MGTRMMGVDSEGEILGVSELEEVEMELDGCMGDEIGRITPEGRRTESQNRNRGNIGKYSGSSGWERWSTWFIGIFTGIADSNRAPGQPPSPEKSDDPSFQTMEGELDPSANNFNESMIHNVPLNPKQLPSGMKARGPGRAYTFSVESSLRRAVLGNDPLFHRCHFGLGIEAWPKSEPYHGRVWHESVLLAKNEIIFIFELDAIYPSTFISYYLPTTPGAPMEGWVIGVMKDTTGQKVARVLNAFAKACVFTRPSSQPALCIVPSIAAPSDSSL